MSLRVALRTACESEHAALDALMSPLALGDNYAEFLLTQYCARKPVEAWLARSAPEGWSPPAQTSLIASDLAALGTAIPENTDRFDEPREGFRGVAWAIAGSSLGNRAMLARRRKARVEAPVSFLSDPAMPAYWQRLQLMLQMPVESGEQAACIRAAREVFAAFARCVATRPEFAA